MNKIITLLSVAALSLSILTPLQLYIGSGQTLLNLLVVFTIAVKDKLYSTKPFIICCLLGVIFVALHVLGSVYYEYYLPPLVLMFMTVALGEHYVRSNDNLFAKGVLLSVYFSLLLMAIISLPQFLVDPSLTRALVEAQKNGEDVSAFAWIMNYQSVHTLVVYVIPLFAILRFSESLMLKLLSLAYIVILCVLMMFADATTALILMVIAIFMCLTYRYKISFKSNIVRYLIMSIPLLLLLNPFVILSFLEFIQPFFEGSSTYNKIVEIAKLTMFGETSGDLGAREEKITLTLSSILENPLFPTMSEKIGKHNYLIDIIAAMGLILVIPHFQILIERLKRYLRVLSPKMKSFYMISFLLFIVMAVMKNFFMFLPACCIVPLFLLFLDRNKDKFKIK